MLPHFVHSTDIAPFSWAIQRPANVNEVWKSKWTRCREFSLYAGPTSSGQCYQFLVLLQTSWSMSCEHSSSWSQDIAWEYKFCSEIKWGMCAGLEGSGKNQKKRTLTSLKSKETRGIFRSIFLISVAVEVKIWLINLHIGAWQHCKSWMMRPASDRNSVMQLAGNPRLSHS